LVEHKLWIFASENAIGFDRKHLIQGWDRMLADCDQDVGRELEYDLIVRKLRLVVEEVDRELLCEEEILEETKQLLAVEHESVEIHAIASISGEWGEHEALVDDLKKALFRDYQDVLVDSLSFRRIHQSVVHIARQQFT